MKLTRRPGFCRERSPKADDAGSGDGLKLAQAVAGHCQADLGFPHEIIAYAAWAFDRFAMSIAAWAFVADLLAERGVIVSRETIRLRANRFGHQFAGCIKCDRPFCRDKWHLDEVVAMINGVRLWPAGQQG